MWNRSGNDRIDIDTLTITNEWELGSDLSSDICALNFDDVNIYACIRNGGFKVINKTSGEVKEYNISESSIWAIIVGDYIYAGNVNGELLVINKADIRILNKKPVHKKNLKSLLMLDDVIYTASQDLSVAKVDKNTLDIIDCSKRCHNKMFYLAGAWQDYLITVSPPCREMKVWRKSDLLLCKTINRSEWGSFIDGNILYEKKGNSIIFTELNDLI